MAIDNPILDSPFLGSVRHVQLEWREWTAGEARMRPACAHLAFGTRLRNPAVSTRASAKVGGNLDLSTYPEPGRVMLDVLQVVVTLTPSGGPGMVTVAVPAAASPRGCDDG